jgi:formamidopyrimidine-DNA glycosylase
MIKALLLDQNIIAGLGNIYVDECLWKSNIHPETTSNKIPEKNIIILCKAIKTTLRSSINAQGTTVVDFTFLNGQPGKYSDQLNIFRKQGDSCPKCSEIIRKKKVAGRGTHFCPKCQVKRY